jgi:hypothetical protein
LFQVWSPEFLDQSILRRLVSSALDQKNAFLDTCQHCDKFFGSDSESKPNDVCATLNDRADLPMFPTEYQLIRISRSDELNVVLVQPILATGLNYDDPDKFRKSLSSGDHIRKSSAQISSSKGFAVRFLMAIPRPFGSWRGFQWMKSFIPPVGS